MTGKELRGQGIDPDFFDRVMFTQFQTWLGETRGIEGCPVNCGYCFFKLDGMTPMKPQQLAPPEEVIKQLRLAPTYFENIPVNFGSQTDVFSTKLNIEYYTKLLNLYGASDYPNPLIFITKRRIPENFIELSKQMPQDVIFYVSYSALAGTGLEPTVVEAHQRDNFVRLHDHGVPVVHYWRPFTPQNSSDEKLRFVLDHVCKYASCSIVNGLRLNSGIKEYVAPFWPQLNDHNFDFSNLGEVWPAGVRPRLHTIVTQEYSEYPVFFGNTPCSVSRSLRQPDRAGMLNGKMCRESNCDQRTLCETQYEIPSPQDIKLAFGHIGIDTRRAIRVNGVIQIAGKIGTQELVYLKNRLRFPIISGEVDYAGGHNWANATDQIDITEVDWRPDEIR